MSFAAVQAPCAFCSRTHRASSFRSGGAPSHLEQMCIFMSVTFERKAGFAKCWHLACSFTLPPATLAGVVTFSKSIDAFQASRADMRTSGEGKE